MVGDQPMVFLGFGKFARADRIYALEPLRGDERGDGRRTRVWVEGIPQPIVASRTERTILHDMGQDAASQAPLLDDALDLAERLVAAADAGRVELGDLGRRGRRRPGAATGGSTTEDPAPRRRSRSPGGARRRGPTTGGSPTEDPPPLRRS